jgi:hypothetical protein
VARTVSGWFNEPRTPERTVNPWATLACPSRPRLRLPYLNATPVAPAERPDTATGEARP